MRWLELKVPPVAVVALSTAAMWLASRPFPGLRIDLPGGSLPAAVLIGAGIVVSVLGVIEFRRAGTTVDPTHPAKASSVVSTGIYAYSRNPMYLGFLLTLTGCSAYLSHWLTLPLLPLFVSDSSRGTTPA